jgi:DNA-binding NarL/FixJ family response regulator
MKMKVLIVDNHPDDLVVTNMRDWIAGHFPGSHCQFASQLQFDSAEVLSYRPDIVILDVALTVLEEAYLSRVEKGLATFDPEKLLSGIKYCRRLKASFSNLPVILMSQFFCPSVLTNAIEAGADGFIPKERLEVQHFIPALEATFVRHKTDDIAFYARLRVACPGPSVQLL